MILEKQFKNDRNALESVGMDSRVVSDARDDLRLSQEALCGFCAGLPNPHKTRTMLLRRNMVSDAK